MFRCNEVLKLGCYRNVIHGEDYDLWIRLSKVGKIIHLSEMLLKHRISSESITVKYSDEQSKTRVQVAYNYAKSVLPETDYDNFLHFFIKTTSRDLEYRQIKKIVSLTKDIKDNFIKKNNLDYSCKKKISNDILFWFLRWAQNNWRRPKVSLYLIRMIRELKAANL